jgi:coproporphyrinogen III oxidase-like Fe-S oxidoreductase
VASAAEPAPATTTTTPPPPSPAGAYIHLPFCVRKCLYCDFAVTPLGARAAAAVAPLSPGAWRRRKGGGNATLPQRPPGMDAYLATLHAEISATAGPPPGAPPLRTLSFGGGTPSLIPPDDLARLVDAVDAKWGLAPGAEISIEADPGTFDAARLRAYISSARVTRISIGVQSFDDELLKVCGRSHDAADVRAALDAVAAAGPRSWSVDLMSGLPGLDAGRWAASLAAAVAGGPDHVSVYDLQVEAGTPFARTYTPGVAPLPTEGQAAQQFAMAGTILGQAGLTRYEVSNFAASPSHRSAHNSLYWRGDTDWLAFGLGATSRLGGLRVARPRAVREYEGWVSALGAAGHGVPCLDPAAGPPPPSTLSSQAAAADLLTDIVMLRLRTADGLDVGEVRRRFGRAAAAAVEAALAPHAAGGRAVRVKLEEWEGDGDAATWRLIDPAGFVVSNAVIADVFAALDGVELMVAEL